MSVEVTLLPLQPFCSNFYKPVEVHLASLATCDPTLVLDYTCAVAAAWPSFITPPLAYDVIVDSSGMAKITLELTGAPAVYGSHRLKLGLTYLGQSIDPLDIDY